MEVPKRSEREAPIIGFLMATLAKEFDPVQKEILRARYRNMFSDYVNSGLLSSKSQFFGEIEEEKDMLRACETLTDIRCDGIVFHPLTWPSGEVITAMATYRYLKDLPVYVSASPEVFDRSSSVPCSWPQNSDCGKIFTNSILYKLGRKAVWGTGLPEEERYRQSLERFFKTCSVVKKAKRARVAVIGNIMDDFPESFYNPMTVRRETGIRIMEIDSSVLYTLYETGEYPSRNLSIHVEDIDAISKETTSGTIVKADKECLSKSSRLYLCYKTLLESLIADGVVIRCAPEFQEKLGLVLCGPSARLLDNGVVGAVGCEGDVLNTVTGLLQYYASDLPTTCLDWVDRPNEDGVGRYTVMHCGNACKTMIHENTGILDYHQAWTYAPLGYTIEGAIKKGPVTLARLRENREGRLELLLVEGKSVADRMVIRGNYGSIDFGSKDRAEKIGAYLNDHGWPHHVSLGWGHHADILEQSAKFLGDITVIRM